PARMGALDVASTHVDARGAHAVAAPRRRRPARIVLPTAPRRPRRRRRLLQRPPGPRAVVGTGGPVQRLRFAMVLRGVHPAVHLPHRLHPPASVGPPPGDALGAGAVTPEPQTLPGPSGIPHPSGPRGGA